MPHDLAILGAGNMAEAIARAVTRDGAIPPNRIIASDPSDERRDLFQSDIGILTTQDNRAAVRDATTVLLSVKPQQMAAVLSEIAPALKPDALIVSIAAGISSSFIQRHLPGAAPRIVRAMPNTPMLVGEGIVALARGE